MPRTKHGLPAIHFQLLRLSMVWVVRLTFALDKHDIEDSSKFFRLQMPAH